MSYIDKLIERYGNPASDNVTFEHAWMTLLVLPGSITDYIKNIPAKLYVNKDLVEPLQDTLLELIKRNLHTEIKTFDGCFNIRLQRNSNVPSVHSFGLAIDLNAKDNPFGHSTEQDTEAGLTPFTPEFLQCWRDMGWIDGEDFGCGRNDAMHFEWTKSFMTT